MKKTTLTILLLCLFFPLAAIWGEEPAIFEETYTLLKEKKKLPLGNIEKLENVKNLGDISLENFLTANLLIATTFSAQDEDALTKKSILLCDEIINSYPDTWQTDFMRFIRLANYGLLANYEQQINLAKESLEKIDFVRFSTTNHGFLEALSRDVGDAEKRLRNDTLIMLGYAYRERKDFDKARETLLKIDNSQIRGHELKQLNYAEKRYEKNVLTTPGNSVVEEKPSERTNPKPVKQSSSRYVTNKIKNAISLLPPVKNKSTNILPKKVISSVKPVSKTVTFPVIVEESKKPKKNSFVLPVILLLIVIAGFCYWRRS